MSTLAVTLVQTAIVWEDAAANRAHLGRLLADVGDTDLIVLPEMFSTGFSMHSRRLAETMEGPTVGWLRDSLCRPCSIREVDSPLPRTNPLRCRSPRKGPAGPTWGRRSAAIAVILSVFLTRRRGDSCHSASAFDPQKGCIIPRLGVSSAVRGV